MSALASSSRLSPLTPATPSNSGSGAESPSSSYATSYSARMASAGSSLSRASSISSTTSSSSSRRGSASAASPVIRNGFIIPSITLTPPDDKPRRSPSLPWQDYTSKSTLYVPVKTEDIGWEEGGLWWHGQWTYPEVQIYGGQDDRVVGKYRGGPEGYRYMEVWDIEGYGHQQPKKMEEPAPQKSSSASSSSSGSSSSSSRRRSSSSSSSTSSYRRRDSTDSLADDSSTASSRRTSDSTVDTACTTPCDTPSRSMSLSMGDGAASKTDATSKPATTTTIMEEPAPFDKEELSSALLALRSEKAQRGETDDDAAAATATPSPPLKPGKTLHLSDEGPSATHRWPKGRGVAKLAETPATAAQRLRGSGGSSSSSPLAKPQSILPS